MIWRKTVHRRTEGNPLFVNEVIRELHHGDTEEGSRSMTSIPEGIKDAIGRRFNRLSDSCNQVLTIASVIGREFSLNLLGRLIPDQIGDRLLEVLEEALAAGIIQESSTSADSYLFTHALIQETVIGELASAVSSLSPTCIFAMTLFMRMASSIGLTLTIATWTGALLSLPRRRVSAQPNDHVPKY